MQRITQLCEFTLFWTIAISTALIDGVREVRQSLIDYRGTWQHIKADRIPANLSTGSNVDDPEKHFTR